MTQNNPKQSRQSRIEALRREIAAGTYSIDAGAVAHALIEHMQQKQRRRAA